MEEIRVKIPEGAFRFQHHDMPHLDPLDADRIHQHPFLHQFIHIIIGGSRFSDFFIQAVGADGGDPFFADIAGLAFRGEKSVVRDQACGDGKVFMLQIHHIDGVAEDLGCRVHQVLQPVSGEQGVDQEVHSCVDLLESGDALQGSVEQCGLGDGAAEIGKGKGTAPIAGKIHRLSAAEKCKFRVRFRVRHLGGRAQIKGSRVKNGLGRVPEPGKQQIPGRMLLSKYQGFIPLFFQFRQ